MKSLLVLGAAAAALTQPMKKLLFATSIVALSTAAHAGITCNLTDQQGNALQYSFARGGHGYTNETVVKRNGAILSNGGPTWTRTYDSRARTMTLQQSGWSLVYEAKPNNSDVSQAALFAPSSIRKATGTCVANYSTDSPSEVASTPAPAPSYDPPPAAPVAGDDVPFIHIPDMGNVVTVLVGGHSLPMLIDTGASMSKIPPELANQLIAEGHAREVEGADVRLADGSTRHVRMVAIDTLTIGNHTRSQIWVGVGDGSALLGEPVLSAIGRYTIDSARGVLTFS